MGAIDGSIVNVAIDHIRGSVGATLEEITWVHAAERYPDGVPDKVRALLAKAPKLLKLAREAAHV